MAKDDVDEVIEEIEEEVVEKPDRGDEAPADPDDQVAEELAEEEEVEEPAEKPGMIPKGRFDDVLNERNWLREQLAKLGANSTQNEEVSEEEDIPAFDFAAKRREQMTAWEEGDDAKYLAIEREIMAATEEIISARAAEIAGQTITQREHQNQYKAAVSVQDVILQAHPELNQDSNEYFAFIGHRDKAVREGYTIDQALKIAEMAVYGDDEDEQPQQPAQPSARKVAAIRRNAAAAVQQPPLMEGGVGQRNAGVRKISQMTDAEFDALPAAEKKRLRGD